MVWCIEYQYKQSDRMFAKGAILKEIYSENYYGIIKKTHAMNNLLFGLLYAGQASTIYLSL